MANDRNDELAGIISEPGRGAPEVKPARSLWPRPHEDVKIEPVLGEPRVEPLVPRIPRDGDFETVPSEGYQIVTPPRAEEHVAAPDPVAERVESPTEVVSRDADELLAEIARRLEPSLEKKEPVAESIPEVESPRAEEPVAETVPEPTVEIVTEPVRESDFEDAPVIDPRVEEPGAQQPATEQPTLDELVERSDEDGKREPTIEELAAVSGPREPNRISVLDADRASESADIEGNGGRSGRFLAMAAGIIVALALGALGFIYLAPAFGIGGTQTASNRAEKVAEAGADHAAAATSAPTSVADASPANASENDLKAIRDHLDQLEQRLAKMEGALADSNRAAAESSEKQLKDLSARIERVEKRGSQSANAAPTPTPTPVAAAPQTTASAPRDVTAPNPTSNSQGTPSEPRSAGPIVNEAPASETPPAIPTPRPTATARAEPATPPTPRLGASPDNPVVNGWVVRDIYNGMAVLQGRRGMVEVEPGDELPDGNKVLAIRRLGGDWVVVTEQGIIASRQ